MDRNSERQTLQAVLERIGNPSWDLLIVGDGSGSGWHHACGWAATLVCNRTQGRRFFYGGMDNGSVNFAESMPYIHALTWYDKHYGKELLQNLGHLNVHILTDSQVIAQWGTQAMQPDNVSELPRKQLILFAGLREFRRLGYHCRFHWAPRMTSEFNWAADVIAGLARAEVMKAADPSYVIGNDHATRAANAIGNLVFHDPLTGQPLNPYNVNPRHDI